MKTHLRNHEHLFELSEKSNPSTFSKSINVLFQKRELFWNLMNNFLSVEQYFISLNILVDHEKINAINNFHNVKSFLQ